MRIILLFFLINITLYANPKVRIELQSGISQEVELLRGTSDTLYFGGDLDGVFRQVAIARSKIISLRHGQTGNKLNADSLLNIQQLQKPEKLPWTNTLALFPPEGPAAGPLSRRLLESLALLLADANGEQIRWVDYEKDFPSCSELDCILEKLKVGGAKFLLAIHADSAADLLNCRFRFISVQSGDSREFKWSGKASLGDFMAKGIIPAYTALTGQSLVATSPPVSWVKVETDPEGAEVRLQGKNTQCRTPCTLRLQEEGRVVLEAYWEHDQQYFAGRTTLHIRLGDTLQTFIRLQRSKMGLILRSQPPHAEIFPMPKKTPLKLHNRALTRTPAELPILHPGEHGFLLFKPGYRDTLVKVLPDILDPTIIHVEMEKISDSTEFLQQKAFFTLRQRKRSGLYLAAASSGAWVGAALLRWLAEKDYDRARNIRRQLEQPSTQAGPGFQERRADNKKAWEEGQNKVRRSAGMAILGAGMLSTGLILWF